MTTFDASQGGIGGCPYAPGASGNIVTEDLVYLLESMGLRTGIDIDRLVEAREWLKQGIPGEPLYGFIPDAGVGKTSNMQRTNNMKDDKKLPLAGIRVLEFVHMVMGPACGLLLADLGAEVIKIEPLPQGDNTRRLMGSGAGYWMTYNRNKKVCQ